MCCECSLLTAPLHSLLSPLDYCVIVELVYCWYGVWVLRREKSSTGLDNTTIGHMVNSDTNMKYVIVHNISFILLFIVRSADSPYA